ncbi:hypothetical protein LIER_32097 [Lithospermum erythrorhizon]|uniref:Uncharacterized protein n=1 Tax=Lithospermum erythrorhizon TaxID=34254 RepID=A0AAV3RTR3_LITER
MNVKNKEKFTENQVFMEEDQGAYMASSVMMEETFGGDNPLDLNKDINEDGNMQDLLNNLVQLGKVLQESNKGTTAQAESSVSKLAKESGIKTIFYSNCCTLQDFKTSKVLVVTKEANGLYIFDSNSLLPHFVAPEAWTYL